PLTLRPVTPGPLPKFKLPTAALELLLLLPLTPLPAALVPTKPAPLVLLPDTPVPLVLLPITPVPRGSLADIPLPPLPPLLIACTIARLVVPLITAPGMRLIAYGAGVSGW